MSDYAKEQGWVDNPDLAEYVLECVARGEGITVEAARELLR